MTEHATRITYRNFIQRFAKQNFRMTVLSIYQDKSKKKKKKKKHKKHSKKKKRKTSGSELD